MKMINKINYYVSGEDEEQSFQKWGQFATEASPYESQEGVAGTSAAIQILQLADKGSLPIENESDRITDGKRYVRRKSRNLYGGGSAEDQTDEYSPVPNVYKMAAAVSALYTDFKEDELGEETNKKRAMALWKLRDNNGWKDVPNDEGHEDLPTSVVLLSLFDTAVWEEETEDFLDLVEKVADRTIGGNERVPDDIQNGDKDEREVFLVEKITEVAMCLLLLCKVNKREITTGDDQFPETYRSDEDTSGLLEWKSRHNREYGYFSEHICDLAGILNNYNKYIDYDFSPYYLRTFYTTVSGNDDENGGQSQQEEDEQGDSSDEPEFRYQPFLTDVVAALALLRSGHYPENSKFIERTVKTYKWQTEDGGLFTPNREPHPPISDNLWIGRLFVAYHDHEPESYNFREWYVTPTANRIKLKHIAIAVGVFLFFAVGLVTRSGGAGLPLTDSQARAVSDITLTLGSAVLVRAADGNLSPIINKLPSINIEPRT